MSDEPLLEPSSMSPGLVAVDIAAEVPPLTNYGAVDAEAAISADIDPPVAKANIILASLYVSIFLGALDTTVVATLLTIIASDLDALPMVAWVATSYLLSCSAFQPLFGKISDIFGRKPCLLTCNVLFAVGCLMCGSASNFWVLVAGRFVTGIGGGGFNTLGTITMSDIVPLRKRGIYQGYGNISFGLGAASGGIIAGLFPSWRWAFYCQVPVCVFAGIIILFYLNLPEGSPGKGVSGGYQRIWKIDFAGSTILVTTLMALMCAASFGGTVIAFSSPLFAFLVVVSVVGFACFYVYELHYANEPVIPVRLLKQQTVAASSFNCLFLSMATMTNLYFAPFFWLSVKNLSPSDSGLRLVSNFVAISIGSVFAGTYMRKTGTYYYLALWSGVIGVIGTLLIWIMDVNTSTAYEMVVLVLPGFAIAVLLTVSLIAMLSAVSKKDQALVTSIQYGFRSVGCTLGVAIATAFFDHSLSKNLAKNLMPFADKYGKQAVALVISNAKRNSSYAFTHAPHYAKEGIIQAYNSGCHSALMFGVVTCVCSAFCNLFLEENPL